MTKHPDGKSEKLIEEICLWMGLFNQEPPEVYRLEAENLAPHILHREQAIKDRILYPLKSLQLEKWGHGFQPSYEILCQAIEKALEEAK